MAAYKPRAYYPPQPEQFTHQRLIANLSIKDVAAMLHVSQKTVKNWETGKTQIPYSAFKLLKVLTNYDMPDARWEGWCLRDGALWSPANRRFEPHELVYIANMFAMARFWLSERKARQTRPRTVLHLVTATKKLRYG